MKNTDAPIYLSSKIAFKAKLNCSMEKVKQKLALFPGATFISGSKTRFYLDKGEDRHYLFEISNNSISIETISVNNPPNYFLQDALLKLFSLAAFLSTEYSFEPSSIFPEIIEVLSKNYFNAATIDIGKVRQEQTGDIILAKRINQLIGANTELESSVKSMEQNMAYLLIKFILSKYGNTFMVADLEKEKLPNGARLSELLRDIPKASYRLIYLDKQRASLVKS